MYCTRVKNRVGVMILLDEEGQNNWVLVFCRLLSSVINWNSVSFSIKQGNYTKIKGSKVNSSNSVPRNVFLGYHYLSKESSMVGNLGILFTPRLSQGVPFVFHPAH